MFISYQRFEALEKFQFSGKDFKPKLLFTFLSAHFSVAKCGNVSKNKHRHGDVDLLMPASITIISFFGCYYQHSAKLHPVLRKIKYLPLFSLNWTSTVFVILNKNAAIWL